MHSTYREYFDSPKNYHKQFNNASLTNQEFFNSSMYFTDEVRLRLDGEDKFVNEFLVCNNIGRGSYSKVKRVIRVEKN